MSILTEMCGQADLAMASEAKAEAEEHYHVMNFGPNCGLSVEKLTENFLLWSKDRNDTSQLCNAIRNAGHYAAQEYLEKQMPGRSRAFIRGILHACGFHPYLLDKGDVQEYHLRPLVCLTRKDDDIWRRIITFPLFEVQRYYGDVETGQSYDAVRLSGWDSFYSGPGHSYAHEPYLSIQGKKVVIRQSGGLDV